MHTLILNRRLAIDYVVLFFLLTLMPLNVSFGQSLESINCASENILFQNIGEPVVGLAAADNNISVHQGFVQYLGLRVSDEDKKLEDKDLSIYPNPTTDKLYINVKDGLSLKIRIVNPIGQEIFYMDQIQDMYIIDMEGLHNGMYFLSVYEGNNLLNIKPIIKI